MASIPLPNGAKVAIATTLGSALPVSAVTNANPAVATSTAHGLSDGAIVVASAPGWSLLDNSVRRIDDGTTNNFEFEGLNSTSTDRFPVGGGVGSVRAITAWTQIPKIPSFESTGGDPKSGTTSYLDDEQDKEFFTGTNPIRLNYTVSYAPDSAQHAALQAANDSGELTVIRLVLKSGRTLYYPGTLFFNPIPVTTKDNEMVNNVSLALQGAFTSYGVAA